MPAPQTEQPILADLLDLKSEIAKKKQESLNRENHSLKAQLRQQQSEFTNFQQKSQAMLEDGRAEINLKRSEVSSLREFEHKCN